MYDQTEMDVLRQDIEDKVAAAGYDSNYIITFENIVNAVSKLKPGKHDGHLGLSSDHVTNACDELYIHIAMLISVDAFDSSCSVLKPSDWSRAVTWLVTSSRPLA